MLLKMLDSMAPGCLEAVVHFDVATGRQTPYARDRVTHGM
jgi:hypothetical protein